MFIGSDCMVRFLDFFKEINDTFLDTIAELEGYEMFPLTTEEENSHQESNTCVICGRENFSLIIIVRDAGTVSYWVERFITTII